MAEHPFPHDQHTNWVIPGPFVGIRYMGVLGPILPTYIIPPQPVRDLYAEEMYRKFAASRKEHAKEVSAVMVEREHDIDKAAKNLVRQHPGHKLEINAAATRLKKIEEKYLNEHWELTKAEKEKDKNPVKAAHAKMDKSDLPEKYAEIFHNQTTGLTDSQKENLFQLAAHTNLDFIKKNKGLYPELQFSPEPPSTQPSRSFGAPSSRGPRPDPPSLSSGNSGVPFPGAQERFAQGEANRLQKNQADADLADKNYRLTRFNKAIKAAAEKNPGIKPEVFAAIAEAHVDADKNYEQAVKEFRQSANGMPLHPSGSRNKKIELNQKHFDIVQQTAERLGTPGRTAWTALAKEMHEPGWIESLVKMVYDSDKGGFQFGSMSGALLGGVLAMGLTNGGGMGWLGLLSIPIMVVAGMSAGKYAGSALADWISPKIKADPKVSEASEPAKAREVEADGPGTQKFSEVLNAVQNGQQLAGDPTESKGPKHVNPGETGKMASPLTSFGQTADNGRTIIT